MMEHIDGGDLKEVIAKHKGFKEEISRRIIMQILKALAYLHEIKKIMHRDIKPQNLLVDPTCHILKVCDFGSAKKVTEESKQSVSYICSRYYRAPELMFGSRDYGTAIDIWSAGCVIGELIKGEPLF